MYSSALKEIAEHIDVLDNCYKIKKIFLEIILHDVFFLNIDLAKIVSTSNERRCTHGGKLLQMSNLRKYHLQNH